MSAMLAFGGPSPAQVRARAEQERRRREREAEARPSLSFREFIAHVAPRYLFYRHCEELIAVLQRVADGELRRVMVFMPPRHSKSETVSRLFTAYYLHRHPDRFVGVASYGADLAYTLSRAARDHYLRAGGGLHKSARAVRHWLTRKAGGLWATGVGGPATGKGYHLGVVDDPIKDAKEAQSELLRRRHQDWWNSVWATREEPGGAQIVVQTRWHEEDLSGYLLTLEAEEPEGWYVVHMPAIAEEPPAYPPSCTLHPDWRREGEALCEERYPLGRLEKMLRRIGDYFFGALFQQRPRPRAGAMFPEALPVAGAVPLPAVRVRYWDLAGAAKGRGDYTAGVLLAFSLADRRTYVEDVQRGQWKEAERTRMIVQTAHQDRQRYGLIATFIEQPPGLAVEVVEDLIRALRGFTAYADPVSGDKASRAAPAAAQAQAGNLIVVDGPWNAAYTRELAAFPYGANDDQVDGTSGAFNILAADEATETIVAPDEDAARVAISPY
jgi:predicted phage terminase large subunit-like protein